MMPPISLGSAYDKRNRQSVSGHILSLQYLFHGAKKTVSSFVQADIFQDTLYLEKATIQKEIAEALNESSRLVNKHPSLKYFTM